MICAVCHRAMARPEKRTCSGCGIECAKQVRRMETQAKVDLPREPYLAGRPRRGYGTTYRYPKVRRTSNFVDSVMYEYRRVQQGYKKQ